MATDPETGETLPPIAPGWLPAQDLAPEWRALLESPAPEHSGVEVTRDGDTVRVRHTAPGGPTLVLPVEVWAAFGRVSLTLRRAHGAVVPDPEETP